MKIAFLFILFFSVQSFAFRLTPMVSVFDLSSKRPSKTFTVINEDDKDVSLEVSLTSRSVDSKGKEKREESHDFSFYPPQFVLKKGQRRNIRLSWIGSKDLDAEKAYRLIVRQLPVDTEIKKVTSAGAQINFVFEYVASVYARPSGTKPNLSVKRVKTIGDKKLSIMLENSGNQHQLLNEYDIYFVDPKTKKKVELNSKEKEVFYSVNMLGNSKREILFTPAKALPDGVELKLEKK